MRVHFLLAAIVGLAAVGCSDQLSPIGPDTRAPLHSTGIDAGSDSADAVESTDAELESLALDTLDLEWFGQGPAGDNDDEAADVDTVAGAWPGVDPFGADDASGDVVSTASSAASVSFRIQAPSRTLSSIGATMRLRTIAASGRDTVRNSQQVRWASTAPEVVSVSGSGVVTARSAGTAIILAWFEWHGRTNHAALVVTARGTTPPRTTPPSPPPNTPPSGGGSTVAQAAELPRVQLETPVPARTGRVLAVESGDDLQAAIDSAEYGDEVVLQAGATFTGNFYLRKKPGSGWITIRSSAAQQLPAPGTRVTPADARRMARIVSPNALAAIRTSVGAHHYRLIGLEVTTRPAVTFNYGLVELGYANFRQTTADDVPSWLVLDRSWVHGHDRLHLKRCVSLNSASTAVVDSRLERCHGRGQDTQAIGGWNGPGPFKIVNNYLADAAEVIMFGGANARIHGLVPADIEIRRNHIRQNDYMRNRWLVKNLIELKTAERVLIADNVVENVWTDGQVGFAFNFKSSGDCSWCITRHVTVRSNYVADAGAGMVLSGMDGRKDEALHHVTIRGNVFERIGQSPRASARLFQLMGGGASMTDLIIEQNTGGAPNTLIAMDYHPTRRLQVRHNVFSVGWFGVKGSGALIGTASLDRYAPGSVFTGNVLVGARASSYPPGNAAASSFTAAPATTDNGTRVGADRSAIAAMTAEVRAGR